MIFLGTSPFSSSLSPLSFGALTRSLDKVESSPEPMVVYVSPHSSKYRLV